MREGFFVCGQSPLTCPHHAHFSLVTARFPDAARPSSSVVELSVFHLARTGTQLPLVSRLGSISTKNQVKSGIIHYRMNFIYSVLYWRQRAIEGKPLRPAGNILDSPARWNRCQKVGCFSLVSLNLCVRCPRFDILFRSIDVDSSLLMFSRLALTPRS